MREQPAGATGLPAAADSMGKGKVHAHERAGRHNITFGGPAADFFEGALLGNGAMGVVATTRPDAVMLHFGHNNVWDIRIAEHHAEEIMTFQEVYDRLAALPPDLRQLTDNPWYREYCEMAGDNYSKPYPRPMPCGSLLLRYDRRKAEVLGHTVYIGEGRCTVDFLIGGKPAVFELFVEAEQDRLWMSVTDTATGAPVPLFHEARLIPDPKTPQEFPPAQWAAGAAGPLAFTQILPHLEFPASPYIPHERDKAFRLALRLPGADGTIGSDGIRLDTSGNSGGFLACVELREGFAAELAEAGVRTREPADGEESFRVDPGAGAGAELGDDAGPEPKADAAEGMAAEASPTGTMDEPTRSQYDYALAQTREAWQEYWGHSFVALEDGFLERIWYRNLYFLNCSVKAGVTCPGLFANWSYGSIGAEWHGDYHMNYNTQQPFWVTFSSNHLEKHLPYADMVDHVLPVSRKWARDYYGLPGAYFPHSAYPVDMQMMPYPVPHWGWEICETPWTVQSLWWHYLYSMDKEFLRSRAFTPMKEAVLFMTAYMKRPGANSRPGDDGSYHIYPTVVPELYELTPGFARNSDCLLDLTLTKFIFRAFLSACAVLGEDEAEADLLADVQDILNHFPAYPSAESAGGRVFLSVAGEDPETVYNVPVPLATVFPGEEHGLHSPPAEYEIAVNTYRNHLNEGGNELVFQPLAGARLGILDLERFKRQIRYCLLPNGTCTDKVLMSGGRYSDTDDFNYMSRMGIWFENFALPAVINECLLQSYNGAVRLFPNWPSHQQAEFRTLRAVGGFLVSAAIEAGEVQWIEITSEAGGPLSFYIPWEAGAVCTGTSGWVRRFGGRTGRGITRAIGESFTVLPTTAGEIIRITKLSAM
ncbi:glycoside hydrolase N-terminal domain-containing protein [Paenibacillus sp. FSL K6-1217]|uniref:glycosyl hydrolase family 95 catalytic domain-containing protein n=1 Tax=Paenibacillus sp. FSL K6-1217 TaxID=2921466 RepID=UPI0032496F28